jgi:DNA-binding MarR family transcriptional regulator
MDDVAPVSPDDPALLGSELRVVLGRIVRRLRQDHAEGELTLSEISVLARLDRNGPLPSGALAEQERITPQAMSTILGVLEGRRLVSRCADAADGRRVTLSATPAALTLLAGRRSLTERNLERALREAFTATERRQLVAAVALLERLPDRL